MLFSTLEISQNDSVLYKCSLIIIIIIIIIIIFYPWYSVLEGA